MLHRRHKVRKCLRLDVPQVEGGGNHKCQFPTFFKYFGRQQFAGQPNGNARVIRNVSSSSMKTQRKRVSIFGDVPQVEGGGNHKCQFPTFFKYFGRQPFAGQPNGHARVTRNVSSASMKTQGKKVSIFGDVPRVEGGSNHKCQFTTFFKYIGRQQFAGEPYRHARMTRNVSSVSMKTQGKKMSIFGDVPQVEGGGNHKWQMEMPE